MDAACLLGFRILISRKAVTFSSHMPSTNQTTSNVVAMALHLRISISISFTLATEAKLSGLTTEVGRDQSAKIFRRYHESIFAERSEAYNRDIRAQNLS